MLAGSCQVNVFRRTGDTSVTHLSEQLGTNAKPRAYPDPWLANVKV